MTKVLVITSGDDPHVDMVRKYLDGEIVKFDPYVAPLEQQLTYRWNGTHFEGVLGPVSTCGITAVWFRKPRTIEADKFPVEEPYRQFAVESWDAAVKALYCLLSDCLWVSDPWAIWRANNKLWQLEEAAAAGFNVPNTLVTSSPLEAVRFIESVGNVVTKPLAAEAIWLDGVAHLSYTTRIPRGADVDLSGLVVSPAIFQREITKGLDIRVTVVETETFACEIRQQGEMEGEVDWRRGIESDGLLFAVHDLPGYMRDKCVYLVQKMGLKFGAIEFILDQDGVYWFMENNPNGQWGFVERKTGLPISKALAELFMRGR